MRRPILHRGSRSFQVRQKVGKAKLPASKVIVGAGINRPCNNRDDVTLHDVEHDEVKMVTKSTVFVCDKPL